MFVKPTWTCILSKVVQRFCFFYVSQNTPVVHLLQNHLVQKRHCTCTLFNWLSTKPFHPKTGYTATRSLPMILRHYNQLKWSFFLLGSRGILVDEFCKRGQKSKLWSLMKTYLPWHHRMSCIFMSWQPSIFKNFSNMEILEYFGKLKSNIWFSKWNILRTQIYVNPKNMSSLNIFGDIWTSANHKFWWENEPWL